MRFGIALGNTIRWTDHHRVRRFPRCHPSRLLVFQVVTIPIVRTIIRIITTRTITLLLLFRSPRIHFFLRTGVWSEMPTADDTRRRLPITMARVAGSPGATGLPHRRNESQTPGVRLWCYPPKCFTPLTLSPLDPRIFSLSKWSRKTVLAPPPPPLPLPVRFPFLPSLHRL